MCIRAKLWRIAARSSYGDIGKAKIGSFKEQRLARRLGKSICERIAIVETRAMLAATELAQGSPRNFRLIGVDRDDAGAGSMKK